MAEHWASARANQVAGAACHDSPARVVDLRCAIFVDRLASARLDRYVREASCRNQSDIGLQGDALIAVAAVNFICRTRF